jgi:tetratricopeptide (TPR) repeat protein
MRLRFATLLLVLLLGACASRSGTVDRSWPQPGAPVVVPATPQQTPPAPPPPPQVIQPPPLPAPDFPRSAEQISGQAVVSLMKQAREAREKGEPDKAAGNLERALRIEPRNYFVWSMLAQIYLDQKQYDQAVSVASKSNSLARGNVYVELENWKTIGAALSAQGDSMGALQAQSKVEDIERRIGG